MKSAARTAGVLAGLLLAWGAAGRIDYETERRIAQAQSAQQARGLSEWCANLDRARRRNARIPPDPDCHPSTENRHE